ncbi:F-actin-monooxygenase mical1 isoform X1 [Hypomesus transpacificus]|uniref:F-actin-monooxygenase mical1 isoform X1 n=1 Tax=Hypomesus transpacificus TaxID=137520 RepID=UPI001F07717A|nr:F-actin-monooxygenase mical1 isoform X1 [Hypomesus transpacificus]XP_046896613.1 F-actin-monooxygenase mical1 isoform X1 [Hypomesus transpacificus]XP_046896614.1 F-actin-monooxygenase mical1 isoform X1 [Hypomesus transpacificus]XP_046896615.1 F-actin-monooxygenase mical1 isoform X1 [Hypomesus transpacificus]
MANQEPPNPSYTVFDHFVLAQSCKDVQRYFAELCHHLEVDPQDYQTFYSKLKEKLNYWKAKALWVKLDKRAAHPDYQNGNVCAKNKCLVLGAGPCGLRTAIELALLGAQVVVLEKRESFARNNVLHLWPYTICDLRGLSAKKFYGKFCTGALDHISIRQLQLILLKVALLLGVEVHTGVEFRGLQEPSGNTGWTAKLHPESHPAGTFQFDVFISAGGGRYVPDGFKRKELRGKLAIGITANFINRRTAAEAQVAEISGVARIYNQKFFQDLLTETGIDLENIVYYKDDTHYFVMTAKKKSLLKKGVIKQDYSDAEQLLAASNVDREAMLRYAHDAARFSTGYQLPDMQFAQNHAGRPDVAMFDFTCMHRAENASIVRERRGKKLLIGLVGDCLVEPFWPLGTGIARGFLASLDTAWMVRSWGLGKAPLEVLAQRESVYQLLSQTTPENTCKNYSAYSINPTTRYNQIKLTSIQVNQVKHLYDVEDPRESNRPSQKQNNKPRMRRDSTGFDELLKWCQQHTGGYQGVKVKDLTQSWRSGLALCALIHNFRPHLIDMASLEESNTVHNNQLAFSVLESELGIPPVMSASDMATRGQIDKLSMVLYLTQVRNAFSKRTLPKEPQAPVTVYKPSAFSRTQSVVFFLNKLKHNSLQRRKEKLASRREAKQREMGDEEDQISSLSAPEVSPRPDPDPEPDLNCSSLTGNCEECYFCGQRVYVLERISTEGKFFHRSCFTCHQCGTTLRLGGYTFSQDTGRFYCELHSEDLELESMREPRSLQDREEETVEYGASSEDDAHSSDDNTLDCGLAGPQPAEGQRQPRPAEPEEGPQEPQPPPDPPACQSGLQPGDEDQRGAETAHPVPAPRPSRYASPSPQPSPPVPKPRSIHLATPRDPSSPPERLTPAQENRTPGAAEAGSRPKQSLRKLQLSAEEKDQLLNLTYSHDSDSETPGGSSSCSSSSATAGGPSPPKPGRPREDHWSGSWGPGAQVRDHRNRRCFRRKEEPGGQNQPAKVRSKFSPWNLSSPRLGRDHRLSVLNIHPETAVEYGHKASEEEGADEDEDDDDMFEKDDSDLFNEKFQDVPSDPVQAGKMELMKMRTLERRAKICEMQRFTKAQSIQRRLEEIEVTFKELEGKGVVLERALRGEAGGGGSPEMIEQWIQLVHEKNELVSEESDLMVASRQLELEDKQSMLEMELRKHMELSDSEKTAEQRAEEERVLQQMIEVVDMRDSLVSFLEEKRLKELSEEQHIITIMEAKRHSSPGAQVHWA